MGSPSALCLKVRSRLQVLDLNIPKVASQKNSLDK